ncbi:MAG TPA: hypothetical protein VGX78_05875 [Pirellulales bacterium]|jgi:hypothetical protein|nr:hypothetical protein [Pirellulales bacterium]
MIAPKEPAGDRPRSRFRGGRPQFSMRGMMAVVVLLCVPFAIWGGLLREGVHAEDSPRIVVYIVLSLAVPMLVLVLVSLAVDLWRWLRRR